ncbi:MAG: 3'-5' exonuclease, partial [Huintestinicola sp.]
DGKTDTELQKSLLKIRNRTIEIYGDFCPITITNSEGFPIETNEPRHFFTLAHVAEDYRIHGEICSMLFRMMKDVFAEEKRLKGLRNGLGFNDAEQIACSLLCEKKDGRTMKSALAEELSKSFGVVMIDEFQDSTAVQELIFRMLSKDGCAEAAGTNFFAVGDIKQSIYRFRCADPSLFKADLEQSADYNSEDDRDGRSARILLSKNFRSSRNIVDTVNMVFDDIMSERTGGVQYGKSDRLIFGASLPDDMGPVEIINIGEAPKAGSRTVNADYCRHEAALAAGRIKQLLDTQTITEDGEKRPMRPSDICILLRKTGNAEYYISALKRLGIDCCGGRENGFIDSAEIITVTDLLRAADNPSLDIPMTAVLMSPMFMFTAEDMARIRTASAGTVFSGIAAAANGTVEDKGLYPDGFIQRCRSFYSYFLELRSFAVCRSTEELIRYIYDTTDFVSVMSVLDEDGTHKNNLRRLLTLAASYDNTSANGLSGFVRMLDSMSESGSDLKTESSAAGANAVAIKTIHSSKGLEYPVVFLCDIWSEFHDDEPKSFRRAADNTVFCPQFGTGFHISRKDPDTGGFTSYESFPERAIRTVLSRSSSDEEMMILYVALTRAKNKLIITRRSDPSAAVRRRCAEVLRSGMGKQINSVLFGSSAEDWLDTVFCTENAEAAAGDGFVETVEAMDIPLPDAADDASDEGSEERDISEEFARLMSCGYDSGRAGLSAKLTVTELAKGGRSETPTGGRFFDKPETDAPKGISAAERGTAVHAFMQNADMSVLRAAGEKNFADAVKKEAERMCRMGLISKRQGECISPKMIGGFVRCGLFERMADSDEIIRERKFLVKISDLCLDDSGLNVYNGTEGMLQGVADCIFREKDGYVLVDYKTDRNVTEEMLTDRYEKQLRLYAAAFSLILDAPVKKAYIYSFCLSKEIEVKIN